MPILLVILPALAGFIACFALSNLLTWHRDEPDHSARFFGLVCLSFAGYVLLQFWIFTSHEVTTVAMLLRWQGFFVACTFTSLIHFGAKFARRRLDRLDLAYIGIYVFLGAWSLASPSGYWFASVSCLEPIPGTQGLMSQPRGPLAWTYYLSIAAQYPMLVRQILDGRRAIKAGWRIDGWLWVTAVAAVLVGGTHDHLVDFGILSPPYLTEYPFPLAMLAMGTRFAQRRSREFARLRQLQRAIARSEAKLKELYESSSDAIFIHDAESGAIVDVNRTMCEMYGYTRDECLKLTVADLSAADEEYSLARARERLDQAQRIGIVTFSWRARRKDKSEFPVEVTLKRTELNGKLCIVANVRDQTEREANVRALRQEKEFVSKLLESLPGTFYLYDRDLRLRRWNRNLEVSFGYSAEQLSQMSMADRYPPGPERDELMAAVRLWFERGRGDVQRETRVLRADGTLATQLITATKLDTPDGVMLMGVGLDITSRVQAQAALRESEERYRTLFDAAGDAILLLREDRFVDCNEHALQVYGCERREQLIGHSPQEFSPDVQPNDVPSSSQALERISAALSGAPQRFEWVHRRANGSTFLAEVSLNRVDLQGVNHLQAIVRDVTEKRRLEERLRQAQRLEAIGHLAGGVAHDFNNLLTPIIGHVELLLEDLPRSDPARDDLAQVLSAANRARRLIQQLLSVGRRGVLEVQSVDICALVLGMKGLFVRLLREDIELVVDVAPHSVVVTADPSHIEQVLMNLVVNARDAMPHGGRLTVEINQHHFDGSHRTALVACEPGEYARLSISDTGIGMTDEVQRRLFEPFFTTKSHGHGTGLGLATVLGIVEQHRGTLTVASEPGRGSTLCVFLPLAQDQQLPIRDSDAPAPAGIATEMILVVEDEESVRTLACRALERHGYRTVSANSAESALSALDEIPVPPHLVITDVVLPKMNGRELFEQLLPKVPGIRVLYMSGYSDETVTHHGVLKSGVVLLQKPFSVEQLLTKVRLVLDA